MTIVDLVKRIQEIASTVAMDEDVFHIEDKRDLHAHAWGEVVAALKEWRDE